MHYNLDILNKIKTYGALKYDAIKICNILGIYDDDRAYFISAFDDDNSDINRYYNQGIAIGDYNIDAELVKQAERGDVLAVDKIEQRQYRDKVDSIKKQLFNV